MRLHRGLVTRASTAGVWVTMAATWPGVEFGPLPLLANVVRVGPLTGTATGTTGSGGDPSHTHSFTGSTSNAMTEWLADKIVAGQRVLVAEVDTDDFIVLGVMRGGVSATGGA